MVPTGPSSLFLGPLFLQLTLLLTLGLVSSLNVHRHSRSPHSHGKEPW